MNTKQRLTLTEVKVGIFVLVSCFVLALAIFAIGSQVGLFEDQFTASTFLSNVSGLKPGDVVLLGGVEVGNVTGVRITRADELPETAQNSRTLEEVRQLESRLEAAQAQLPEAVSALDEANVAYQQAVSGFGAESRQANSRARQVETLRDNLQALRDRVESLKDDIENTRGQIQNIEVTMRINSVYRDWIRADSNISLGSIGLLGDKYIEISLGRTAQPPLITRQRVEGWFGDRETEVVVITGTQQASFEELITGANDILANFKNLSRKVDSILGSFQEGEGTVGKFLNDPEFYNNMSSTIRNTNRMVEGIGELVQDMRTGPGTVSSLIQQRDLYDRILSSVERLESILGRIDQGEGTLGKLVKDPSLYDRADQVMASLEGITGRMDSGEGTLGRLSTDRRLYDSLADSVEKLSLILRDVEDGKGTLGRLTKDEELYRNLNQLSSEMVKLIYDFRQNPKKFLTVKLELF